MKGSSLAGPVNCPGKGQTLGYSIISNNGTHVLLPDSKETFFVILTTNESKYLPSLQKCDFKYGTLARVLGADYMSYSLCRDPGTSVKHSRKNQSRDYVEKSQPG